MEMIGRASGPIKAGREERTEEKIKEKEVAKVARKGERKERAHAMPK